MNRKIRVDRPIIVEGKYDKIKLESVIQGNIITTDGFGVFKSKEKKILLRRLAEPNGVIVLTDSDGGGLVIRNYINSILPKDKVINLYIPEIKGREKRKKTDSKEGLLGVEGISCSVLEEIFKPFSANADIPAVKRFITKADMFDDGLSGGTGSSERRRKLCRAAGLPENISSNALLEALNLIYGYSEYKNLIGSLNFKD